MDFKTDNTYVLVDPLCPLCETGLRKDVHDCPGNLLYLGDEGNQYIDKYVAGLEMNFIEIVDGCDCCIECKMVCRCDQFTEDFYDYEEDDEDFDFERQNEQIS